MPHQEQSSEGADLEARVRALESFNIELRASHLEMRKGLADNTAMTAAVKADTAILVEFAKAAQGIAAVGRVIAAIGRFFGRVIAWVVKYILPFVIAGAALWAVVTGRKTP